MKRYFKYLPKLFSPIMFIFYCFVYFIPRSKKHWVFGSGIGMNFSDNAKYLFLYSSSRSEIYSCWISRNKILVKNLRSRGLNAYYKYSVKQASENCL